MHEREEIQTAECKKVRMTQQQDAIYPNNAQDRCCCIKHCEAEHCLRINKYARRRDMIFLHEDMRSILL